MLLVWRMRQDIEVQKTRVMAQATLSAGSDTDAAEKTLKRAWDDYLDEAYPFQRGRRVNADKAALEYLKSEAARGPITVRPLQSLSKTKSRIRSRANRGQGT